MYSCVICSYPASIFSRGSLFVVKCNNGNCRHIALDVRNWVSPYCHKDYYDNIQPSHINPERPFISYRVDLIEALSGGKRRIVDLGCGLGDTVINLHSRGYDVCGVEESENAVAFLKGHYPDIRWTCESIVDFLKRTKEHDIFTMFHVLEHVNDPKEVIGLINEKLSYGGLVVIEVPDVGGGLARLRGIGWEYWLSHHTQYFSRRSLNILMKSFGFTLIHTRRLYHFGYPQGVLFKDIIHGVLAHIGFNNIIRTVWKKASETLY